MSFQNNYQLITWLNPWADLVPRVLSRKNPGCGWSRASKIWERTRFASWEGQANLLKHEDERIKNCMYFLSSRHLQVTPLLTKLARSGNMAGYWPLSLITVFWSRIRHGPLKRKIQLCSSRFHARVNNAYQNLSLWAATYLVCIAGSIKAALGIGNWAIGSYCLVVTQAN